MAVGEDQCCPHCGTPGAVANGKSRLKDFLRGRRGIATKYLHSYLRWFHLIGLHPDPTPRHCLAAAIGG